MQASAVPVAMFTRTGTVPLLVQMSDPMSLLVAQIISFALVAIAAWHFYMALVPRSGLRSGVPTIDGKPLFFPSRKTTIAVGVVLLLCAGLVAATAGIVSVGLPPAALSWLSCALALGLFARAVGEFNYVGFFKRFRGSRFATLDTLVYSPLCLLLAMGVVFVALHKGA